jgi:hypothetical protein
MINKMKNVFAPHIDFSFLYGVIPENPKAQPCNVDMMFQRKDKVLVGEWKRPNENMNKGQEILLNALSKQPNFIVILINGHSVDGDTEVNSICKLIDGEYKEVGKGIDGLKKLIINFYRWADN